MQLLHPPARQGILAHTHHGMQTAISSCCRLKHWWQRTITRGTALHALLQHHCKVVRPFVGAAAATGAAAAGQTVLLLAAHQAPSAGTQLHTFCLLQHVPMAQLLLLLLLLL
jgi:hypothetical protein